MNPKEYYGGTIEDGMLRSPLIKIYTNNEDEEYKYEEIGKNDEECLHKQTKLLLYIVAVSLTITAITYIIIFSLRHHNSLI